uniref:Tetraspanin n=1 Tax=Parascaris equorum TaxID=6256 RepID=A0A914RFF7_PAREQ
MVYGCGNRMVKFLFFSANLLICFFGGLIFGFSMWANLDKDFAANLEKFARSVHHDNLNVLAKYQASLWVLVAIGALLFLVGFLGCCGAMCESTVLLSLVGFPHCLFS